MTRLASVQLLRLEAPLRTPYHWSHGALEHFDLVFAVVCDHEGRVGVGETAPVAGYGHEDLPSVWGRLRDWAPELVGLPLAEAWSVCDARAQGAPFAATALTQALECLLDESAEPAGAVPLVGTVNVAPGAPTGPTVRALVDAGHTVLKLKIGFDTQQDIARVREAAAAAAGDALLRLDANQAYTPQEARAVLEAVGDLPIELVEQPLPGDQWDEMALLHASSPVPLMLDEAILGEADIRRAAGCATFVKFKLMKSGGPRRLRAHVDLAASLGLQVVIGNGVVSGYGAYAEARVHRQAGLATAGEMNGFAKLVTDVLAHDLDVRGAALRIGEGARVDLDRLRAAACEEAAFGAALTSPP
jgi:L-Ala-D/L-Glu epimerase